jgi:hypothetical protein
MSPFQKMSLFLKMISLTIHLCLKPRR